MVESDTGNLTAETDLLEEMDQDALQTVELVISVGKLDTYRLTVKDQAVIETTPDLNATEETNQLNATLNVELLSTEARGLLLKVTRDALGVGTTVHAGTMTVQDLTLKDKSAVLTTTAEANLSKADVEEAGLDPDRMIKVHVVATSEATEVEDMICTKELATAEESHDRLQETTTEANTQVDTDDCIYLISEAKKRSLKIPKVSNKMI